MNLALLDPLARNSLPEHIEEALDDGGGYQVTCCTFNRKGNLLAVGAHDGRVTIWDFDTRMIAKLLIGHVRPVTSVSWSKTGRKLLTSSLDWNVRIWDIVTSNFLFTKTFDSMIINAQLHPGDKDLCLVSAWMEEPFLVNTVNGKLTQLALSNYRDEPQKKQKQDTNCIASFNIKGNHIYLGSHEGIITIIDTQTLKEIASFSIVPSGPGPSIKSFAFSRDEKQFLVNSSDKSLRLYNISFPTCFLSHELVDPVNKIQWKSCHFAGDDYIVGGSADKQEHKIYIWSREFGQLYKILEGQNSKILLDIACHPSRSIIASCTSGLVYVWSRQHTESWSAFAPGFTELEENEEYIEQEDEFDAVDEDQAQKKKAEQQQQDEYIDILTRVDKDAEEEEFILPTHPIPDTYFAPQTLTAPSDKKQQKKRKPGGNSTKMGETKTKRRKKE